MNIPTVINVQLDVPIDLKIKDDTTGINILYGFNFMYGLVAGFNIDSCTNGENNFYNYYGTWPIMEIKGGLAYYDYGWKIFSEKVQEEYSGYIANKEILSDD